MRRLAVFLAAGSLSLSGPALAWEAEMHGSLVEAALLVSPAAKARIPGMYVDTVIRGAKEAKTNDERGGDCIVQPDAPDEAQRTFDFLLRNPKWSHNFALNVGRVLHFAADSVVTDAVAHGGKDVRRELFTNHDFMVFREPRADRSPLAAALRGAAKEAHFADNPSEDDALRYRAAVNVIADVLLRLPPLPDAAGVPDGGVGLFVVDTLDTGLGGIHVTRETSREVGSHIDSFGDRWSHIETTTWYDPSQSWGGKRRAISIDTEGVHIMDRANRRAGDDLVTRMAIFNNTPYCGSQLILSSGKWKLDVVLDLPPRAVRVVDVRIPMTVAVGAMTTSEFRVSELCRTTPAVVQLTSYARTSGTTSAAPDVREAKRFAFSTTPTAPKRPFSQ
jgi:hypothetical protein